MPQHHPSPAATPGGVRTIFLVGPPRCGTTLLGFLLAGGERVLSLSEPFRLHTVFPRWGLRCVYWRLAWSNGIRVDKPRGRLTEAQVMAHIRGVAARNKMATLVVKETFRSKREWVNLELLDSFLASGEPVVAIMRHPFDSAVSTLKMFRLWRGVVGPLVRPIVPDLPLFDGDADIAAYVARTWCDFSAWCRGHALNVIRYEDLVRSPADRLRELCGQCGIAFDPRMLDSNHPRGPFAGIGDPGVMTLPNRPVSTKSVGRKKHLSHKLQRILREECAAAARQWGYEL